MKAAVLGCAGGIVLWLLAMFCAGGGHGTYLPVAVFGAPLSLIPGLGLLSPLVLWPLVGVAVDRRWRLALLILVLSHACGVGAAVMLGTPFEGSDEQWTYLANAARQIGPVIAVAFILYAAAIGAMIYFAVWRTPPSPATTTG